jgi:hypothetical protein
MRGVANIFGQEYIRGREREYRTPYCCVQTPFAKYRGQLVQYCTQSVHSNPQMSGLITTTIATSCSLALQGWCCGHTPVCITITAVLALVILVSLISVLGKGCLHMAIRSTILSPPPLIYSCFGACLNRPSTSLLQILNAP